MERKTILFQGDSLTDCGRARTNPDVNTGLGDGYVTMVAGEIGCKYPFIDVMNRGVGGNRAADIYARWLEDMREVPFDLIHVYHALNDVGFQLRLNKGSDPERFEFIYDRMLYEVKQTHPDAGIIMGQPYILKKNLEGNRYIHPQFGNDIYENYDLWSQQAKERGEICERLAQKYGAIYVRYWDALEEAQKTISVDDLSVDCIHLTARGNYILAQACIKAIEGYVKKNWL